MNAFWSVFMLLITCVVSQDLGESADKNSSNVIKNGGENNTFQIELFPSNPIYAGQTRTPRKLFHKIHSGAAFLAGLKVGTILSKKGFELGHGKIASTHSFHLFGTPVNSAMSLSYGNVAPLLPLVDDEVDKGSGQPKRSALKKGGAVGEENVFHVTVIESPSSPTADQLQTVSSQFNDSPQDQVKEDEERETPESDQVKGNVIRLYEDLEKGKVHLTKNLTFYKLNKKEKKNVFRPGTALHNDDTLKDLFLFDLSWAFIII